MAELPIGDPDRRRRERWIAASAVTVLVLWRTLPFVIWGQSHFDSDQAVFGLMAKHLSERRAFPVFMYGQSYILAVEAWMAAPLFAVFGPSIAALKLPLVAVNLLVALLLLRTLEREAGLRPALAAVATLFFALPPPGTSADLVAPSGGNVEPFLYILLLWLTRNRPNWCGLVAGIGFLHREFVLYGIAALLLMDVWQRSLFTREGIRNRLGMFRTAAEIWLLVQFLQQFASAAGPGTSIASVRGPSNNLLEIAQRTCIDPGTLISGFGKLIASHWPTTFGASVSPLSELSIESSVVQGVPGAWLLFGATFIIAIAGTVSALARKIHWRREYDFCTYLVAVGFLSAVGYVVGRCGVVDSATRRYELLSILGAVGLGALFLTVPRPRQLTAAWVALTICCAAVTAVSYGRLWFEYLAGRPIGAKELLVRHLEARGIKYGFADYWVAYYVSFVTKENILFVAEDRGRIATYSPIVQQHLDEAVRVSRQQCEGGRAIGGAFFLCPR